MQRNEFIDFLKGALILLVVIGHAMQFVVYKDDGGYWDDPFFQAIYMFHMPLFMLVSGFLSRRSIRTRPAIDLVALRFCQLVVPIFVWAVMFSVARGVFERPESVGALLHNVGREGVGSLWYLWVLFAATALTIITARFRRVEPLAILVVFACVLVAPPLVHLEKLQYLLPFFWIGYSAAGWEKAWLAKFDRAAVFAGAAAVALAGFALWTEESYIYAAGAMDLSADNLGQIALRYLAGFAACIVAIFALWHVFPIMTASVRRAVVWAGQQSLAIYIIQGYAFVVLYKLAITWNFPEPPWGCGRSLRSPSVWRSVAPVPWPGASSVAARFWRACSSAVGEGVGANPLPPRQSPSPAAPKTLARGTGFKMLVHRTRRANGAKSHPRAWRGSRMRRRPRSRDPTRPGRRPGTA